MKVRVSNIQRFCLNDGPGIRTTVFLKGCNLRCPWCANPENLEYQKQKYYNKNTDDYGTFGYDIELDDLFLELMKDEFYFQKNSGGVTFSGGEPLLQFERLEPLLKRLKKHNINICVETALNVPSYLVEIAMKYVDEFIVDIKILNKEVAKKVLNGDIELYYKNLEIISKKMKIYTFRIPLINEYTLTKDNLNLIIELLKKISCDKVEIFKVHNLAESKYQSIGMEIIKFISVTDEMLDSVYLEISKLGIHVEIIKI